MTWTWLAQVLLLVVGVGVVVSIVALVVGAAIAYAIDPPDPEAEALERAEADLMEAGHVLLMYPHRQASSFRCPECPDAQGGPVQ